MTSMADYLRALYARAAELLLPAVRPAGHPRGPASIFDGAGGAGAGRPALSLSAPGRPQGASRRRARA